MKFINLQNNQIQNLKKPLTTFLKKFQKMKMGCSMKMMVSKWKLSLQSIHKNTEKKDNSMKIRKKAKEK